VGDRRVFALDPSLRFAFARPGPEAAFETLLALLACFAGFLRVRPAEAAGQPDRSAPGRRAVGDRPVEICFFGACRPWRHGYQQLRGLVKPWSASVFGSLLFGAAAFAPSRSPGRRPGGAGDRARLRNRLPCAA